MSERTEADLIQHLATVLKEIRIRLLDKADQGEKLTRTEKYIGEYARNVMREIPSRYMLHLPWQDVQRLKKGDDDAT